MDEVTSLEAMRMSEELGASPRAGTKCGPLYSLARSSGSARAGRVGSARATVQHRRIDIPSFRCAQDLPISPHLAGISELIRNHQVVIVAGETGSGKTTQLPLACLNAGLGRRGVIGHTQPRRLAARSVSDRIAQQLGCTVGSLVGCTVRFDDRTGPDTLVRVMTDGILLADVERDWQLFDYECIILDEAHERSLNIDFLVAYLRTLLPSRPDLRLVITSATIDVEAFSKHFDGAPVVTVEGRGHPVELRYRPADGGLHSTFEECIAEILQEETEGVRDILVFLSGEREILEWSRWIRRVYKDTFELLPLYARLPVREQHRIFKPAQRQRIVLATNVAETSITVPNIRYVIDLGRARISRYSTRAKIQRLPVETISQASAEQRAGRCGRVAPGVCFRLCSREEFDSRRAYTDPEIRRSNLAAVILRVRVFRLGDLRDFPLLDRPEPVAIRDAERLLHELGALDSNALTPLGRRLASLPVDPRLGRMLVEAHSRDALAELIVIVAALAVQDPRIRPLDRRDAADRAHARFQDSESDFMAILRLWSWLEEIRKRNSRRALGRLLESNFISPNRYAEWRSLVRQLVIACRHTGMPTSKERASSAAIHRSALAGSLGFVGFRKGKQGYQGARDISFHLSPASVLTKRRPKWVVAAEISETERTFARCVARIEPRWVEDAAAHLLKHTYQDPHWNQRRGQPMVLRTSKLYGLPVSERRPVPLGPHDPELAQDLFVRHMLIRPEELKKEPFAVHNRRLVCEIEALQACERTTALIVTEDRQVEFFKAALPCKMHTRRSFNAWYRSASEGDRSRLFMQRSDLLARSVELLNDQDFPGRYAIGNRFCALKYRFAPGALDDGVNLQVSLSQIGLLKQQPLEWLVPGFVGRKIEALIRGLPKRQRKRFLPVNQQARLITESLLEPSRYRMSDFGQALTEAARRALRDPAFEPDWNLEALDPFHAMNVQVLTDDDRVVAQGRDLHELKERLTGLTQGAVRKADLSGIELRGLTRFPSSGLPEEMRLPTEIGILVAVPVLMDTGASVDLVLDTERKVPFSTTQRGLARLYVLEETSSKRYLQQQVAKESELLLHYSTLGSRTQFLDSFLLGSAWHGVLSGHEVPRSLDDWIQIRERSRGAMVEAGMDLLGAARNVLQQRAAVALLLENLVSPALAETKRDMDEQLNQLVSSEFLWDNSMEQLGDVTRYLRAMEYRATHLQGRLKVERNGMACIKRWAGRLERIASGSRSPDGIADLERLLQEYRIALFSQPIGTSIRISEQRLERAFTPVERRLRLDTPAEAAIRKA